jgi:hypothetical protein
VAARFPFFLEILSRSMAIASTTQKQRAKSPWEGIASRGPCPLSLSHEGYFLELAMPYILQAGRLPSRTQDGDVVPHVFQTLGPVHGCKTNNNSKLASLTPFSFLIYKIIFLSQCFFLPHNRSHKAKFKSSPLYKQLGGG